MFLIVVAIVTMIVSTVILHESSHAVAALAQGLRVKRVGISWKGVYLIREAGSARANIITSLAGPVSNLIAGCICWHYAPWFAMGNLLFGLSNLAPFLAGSDGARVWALIRNRQRGHPDPSQPPQTT